MELIELSFKASGEMIPLDHGYGVYAGLSKVCQAVHDAQGWGILPLSGQLAGPRTLRLDETSHLVLRLPFDDLRGALPLAGKRINVQGSSLVLGTPEVRVVAPAPQLRARYVTIKGFEEEESFAAAAQRQLDAMLGEGHSVSLRVGERRVMRVRRYVIVGFEVTLEGLTNEQARLVLAQGLGGKRKMGAGVFVPTSAAQPEVA